MILFAGDSFSHSDKEDAWTNILAKKLNQQFFNFSLDNTSLWYAYSMLANKKTSSKILSNQIDYIIITCTNMSRIPYCVEPKMSSRNITKIDDNPINFFEDGISHLTYYTKFYSPEMHKFLHEKIIEDLVLKYGNHTKLILLSCFGDCISMFESVHKSYPNFSYCILPLIKIATLGDEYKNHMSENDNLLFANDLYEKITSVDNDKFAIDFRKYKKQKAEK